MRQASAGSASTRHAVADSQLPIAIARRDDHLPEADRLSAGALRQAAAGGDRIRQRR
jgi:hypothetical protein